MDVKYLLSMENSIRTINHCGQNKWSNTKFQETYRVQRQTPNKIGGTMAEML